MTDQFWHEHLRDIVRAMDVAETFSDNLNKNQPPSSDLEFWVPTRIDVKIYDEPAGFHLMLEDDAWYLKLDEEKDK